MSENPGTPQREAQASDYFDVRIEREQLTPTHKTWRAATPILLSFVSPLLFGWGGDEATLNCEVQIYRRSDEHVVATYRHDRETQALAHFHSIESRLAEMTLSDFCAQFGIPAHRVK